MSHLGALGVITTKLDMFLSLFDNKNQTQQKKSVLVVGYGWGGKAFCDHIDYRKYDVTVVSKTDYMLNTPKMKKSIMDTFQITKSIDNKPKFIHQEIQTQDDLQSNQHDYVVLAVGSEPNDFQIPGVKENCFYFKTKEDCEKLSVALNTKKHVVIAGAGPAGLELAFELGKHHKVTLVEAMGTILPNFSEKTRTLIQQQLQKSNINLQLNSAIQKVEPQKFLLKNGEISFDVAIWNCGVKPSGLIRQLTKERSLPVNEYLLFRDNMYAIGDIVASKSHGPPTAQNAVQQGKYLATYFNNDFKGDPYKYDEKGKIIHTDTNILLEIKDETYTLPKFIEFFIDWIIESV